MKHPWMIFIILASLLTACGGVPTRPPLTSSPNPQRLDLSKSFIPNPRAEGEVKHNAYPTNCGILHTFIIGDTWGLLVEVKTTDISFGDCPDLTERIEEIMKEMRSKPSLDIYIEDLPIKDLSSQIPLPPLEVIIVPPIR